MRQLFGLLMTLLPGTLLAGDGPLGTKSGVVGSTAGQTGGVASLFQMLIALGLVLLALKWILPKVAARLNKKLVTTTTGSIVVEESAQFAGGSLYVVRARSKTLLLNVGGTGVTCLADISEPPVQEPTFPDFLDAMPGNPPEEFTAAVIESPDSEHSALDRLNRFLS